MEDDEVTVHGAKGRESIPLIKAEPKKCVCIILPRKAKNFNAEKFFIIIYENIKQLNARGWKLIKKNHGNIVLVKLDLSRSLDIHCDDSYILLSFVTSPSSDISSSKAEASAVSTNNTCECFDTSVILRNILNSADNEHWVIFWACDGKAYVSLTDEQTNIIVEDFNEIHAQVEQLIKLNHDTVMILNMRIPLGETDQNVRPVIMSHVKSQEDFFKEMNEMVYQKRRILKQLNTLVFKHCGMVEDEQEKGDDEKTSKDASQVVSANKNRGGKSIPLRTLLQCIVVRLRPSDWVELRRYVGRDIPSRVLQTVSNDVALFQELENRNLIGTGNTQYITDGFYEIGRVDLVHLLDCIQEGDYSLLTTTITDANIENLSLLSQDGNTDDQSRPRTPSRANTDSPVSGQLEQVVTDGPILSDDTRDRPLQRRYRNIPPRTTPSTPYPVQEQTEEDVNGEQQTPVNISNDNDISVQVGNTDDASDQGTNAEGDSAQSTSSANAVHQSSDALSRGENAPGTGPQGENAEDALSRDENEEYSGAWVESRAYSCEHYDRFCTVKFGCCDQFWPCHRCHNARSGCNERRLRSRDIKKVKCRRCGKIQDFPKESPHCVQCNLKFGEYFCPICQHLTGKQNHPFHCDKCGICRYVAKLTSNISLGTRF